MEHSFQTEVLQKLKQKRRKRFWKRVLSAMMCLVVFCTTYALILPAITKETDTFCGMEAHTHTAKCFARQEDLICGLTEDSPHVHTDDCAPIIETAPLCGLEESEGHTHGEACQPRQEQLLICDIPEAAGHTHDAQCVAQEQVLSCDLAEFEGHTHDDSCYMATLTCALPEDETHTHEEACFTQTLACDLETQGHTHSDSCYTLVESHICGLEETEGHTHSDSCFTTVTVYGCGAVETPGHTHSEACFTLSRCDLETAPHTHTDACYASPLICPLEESEAHTHTISCYNSEPLCGLEAHTHSLQCYSNPEADLEQPSFWESTLPQTLTGNYPQDLLAVALTQLGYTESTKNYTADGTSVRGYTRYGDWYGSPYGDWCAMFVSFCLHYAEVEGFPQDANCPNWVLTLQELGLFQDPSEYVPKPGDIIFFDWEEDGTANHVGIVEQQLPADAYNAARLQCIEGNSGDTVRYTTYNLTDPRILGYGQLPLEKPAAPSIEELIPEETIPEETEESFDAIANIVTAKATGNVRLRSMSYAAPRLTTYSDISAQATDTIDMTGLIEAVTVYKKLNGAWVEVSSGDTVTDGEDLKFTIDYIVPGETLSPEENTLVYQIPSNIKNVADSSGLVYNDAKEAVGTYVIDAASNNISITFFDTYVTDNQLNKPIVGSISFRATVEKITQDGDESQEILFSDKVKIEMEVAEKEEVTGDVKVEKSIAKVTGGVITYEIKVTSQTGTFSEVILTDEMSGGIRYKDGLKITDQNGKEVVPELVDGSSSTNFALILPQMDPGDVYTITYNARPYNMVENLTLVKNKATVNTTNSQNVDINDFSEVDHVFRYTDKVGKLQEDGSILWTIVINQDKQDISGMVLADIMWDTDGSEKLFTGPVTITDSKGNSKQITLPYTFPSGSKDTYTVTYTTTHDLVAGENSVKNRVGLGYGGENDYFYDDAEVGIGENNPLTKEGAFVGRDPETGKSLIQWTITVDTSGGPIPTTAFIHDSTYDTQYMTYAQLQAVFEAINDAVAPFGATISNKLAIIYGTYTEVWNENIDAAGNSNIYNQFYVQFSKEIPQGTSFSFSYTTTADEPPDSGLYYNQVSLNDKVFADANVNHKYEHPVITKVGVSATNNNNQYGVFPDDEELNYEDLSELNGKKTLWWRLRLLVPEGEPVVVKDILPEGMELVGVIGQIWSSWDEGYYKIMYPDKNGYAETAWFSSATSPGYRFSFQTTTGADGRQTVTFDVDDMAYFIGYYDTYLDLYVVAKFRDDFQWGGPNAVISQVPFSNTATIESPDGDVFDTDDHTFVVNYDQSHEVVSKAGALTELNELEYKVKLNVEGRDLDPAKDTIRVTDVLTYVSPAACPIRLYLKPGTVNVYDYTGGVKGALITSAKYTYTEATSGTGDISYTHTLDLVLPDQQPMLLEYVYTVDGKPNDNYSYDMLNTCTITGIAEGSIDSDYQLEVKVNDSDAQANVKGVYIYKVDADNNGLYLPGAVFNVYTWSSQSQRYVRVKHPGTSGTEEAHYAFTTDKDGCLMLNDATMEAIAYNTAYYITEVTPPSGYFNDPTPYYFYIAHADTNKNPMNLPLNFEGDALQTGALIYYYNEPATTGITIYKKWQDHNGNPVQAAPTSSVRFELWRKLEGSADPGELYGTYTIEAANNWAITITGLPKGIVNPQDGTKGTSYLYYIKEVSASNYEVSYEYDDENDATVHDSGGITSGTITMTNREKEGYELPETGGAGTTLYTMAGLLLILISTAFLMYGNLPRRREEF